MGERVIHSKNLTEIKYLVLDVDGTLTDGSVYYDENGNEIKKFSAKDGIGFVAAHICDMKIVVMTGRECKATERRMEELNVDYLFQKVKNKCDFLKMFMDQNNIKKEEVCYIGDDINDFGAMKLVCFVGCPKDACEEVLSIANYVSGLNGGYGAVKDIVLHILKERGQWEQVLEKII